MSNHLGCIYSVAFRYYDNKSGKMATKRRPFLIIKEEEGAFPRDLTCLPVSKVTNKNRMDNYYDIRVSRKDYPLLNLNEPVSYIRSHKVQTINEKDLLLKICDNCEYAYPDLYEDIRRKIKAFYGDIL
ncbi:MAG: type II toxin-antitoxin system PemK/MazF family toxin [Bacillota bacterium]|nr:type II toxin-antitoxin system PemK/MazF family toxin [Bacillota bacterium]